MTRKRGLRVEEELTLIKRSLGIEVGGPNGTATNHTSAANGSVGEHANVTLSAQTFVAATEGMSQLIAEYAPSSFAVWPPRSASCAARRGTLACRPRQTPPKRRPCSGGGRPWRQINLFLGTPKSRRRRELVSRGFW